MGHDRKEARSRGHGLDDRPGAHAVPNDVGVKMVNGRWVSKTLADPDLKSTVHEASKSIYPDKKAFVEEMARRGVLTRGGKLTKASGG